MNINPIQGGYTFGKGLIFAKFEGNSYWEELGNAENFDVEVEVERDELQDNRFGVSRIADSQVTSVKVTLAMTLRQMTDRNRALGVMGSLGYMEQESAEEVEKVFESAKANQLYELGGFDLTNIVVTDGDELDPQTLVLGTDYLVDAATGIFQPLKDGNYHVTFDRSAILPDSGRLKTGLGGNPDQIAEVLYVGANRNGARPIVRIWKARLTPSGARGYISDSDRSTVEIEGEALADATRGLAEGDADEFAFGYEATIATS